MIRVAPRTNRLFAIWRDHSVPPWEVLGTRWTTRAKRCWYLAAERVTREDKQTAAERRLAAQALADAATSRATAPPRPKVPRLIGMPQARRLH